MPCFYCMTFQQATIVWDPTGSQAQPVLLVTQVAVLKPHLNQ